MTLDQRIAMEAAALKRRMERLERVALVARQYRQSFHEKMWNPSLQAALGQTLDLALAELDAPTSELGQAAK